MMEMHSGIGLEVARIKDNQSSEIAKPPSALGEFPIDFPVLLQCKPFWFAKGCQIRGVF